MSDLKLPGDEKKKPTVSWQRLVLWLVVGGVAIYLIVTGLAGVIAKG
jgi:hypothetical protein